MQNNRLFRKNFNLRQKGTPSIKLEMTPPAPFLFYHRPAFNVRYVCRGIY